MSVFQDTPAALYSRLQGGTALTALLAGTVSIYDSAAPNGATYDYVIYNFQGGGPDLQTPANLENNVWLVRGYSRTSAKAAKAIAAAIDARLHQTNISIGSATTFWCAREENVAAVQQGADNQQVWLAGGMYRIRTTGG
jgi:hypothetical protein